MFYRMRVYEPSRDDDRATRLFEEFVRPVHERHGAVLIGRWRTFEGRTVVIWKYDSEEDCRRVLAAAAVDPEIRDSQPLREAGGLAGVERQEWFMTSTVDGSS
jgi:hypothetical protein